MAERRTISAESPGLELELELDEGLEDTICVACLPARRRAAACPHTAAQRAAAMTAAETQQLAAAAAASPRAAEIRVALLRRIFGWRPWWTTPEGRARMRERLDRERDRR